MVNSRKVKQLRLGSGMTQNELAKVSDVSIQTISYIENGHQFRPSMSTLGKLAKALKVKPAELLK